MIAPIARVPAPAPAALRLAAVAIASARAAHFALARLFPRMTAPEIDRQLSHVTDWLVQEAEDREAPPAPLVIVSRVVGSP